MGADGRHGHNLNGRYERGGDETDRIGYVGKEKTMGPVTIGEFSSRPEPVPVVVWLGSVGLDKAHIEELVGRDVLVDPFGETLRHRIFV